MKDKRYEHGLSQTRLYRIYHGMKQRCCNKRCPNYERYGKVGKVICKEWLECFMNFYKWAISHGYDDCLVIDRIDGSKGYCPDNCRWTTYRENNINRTGVVFCSYKGKRQPLCDWALDPRCKANHRLLCERMQSGWSFNKAFETPPMNQHAKRGFKQPKRQKLVMGTRGLIVNAFGKRMSITEWSKDKRCKVSRKLLAERLRKGIDPEKAISSPSNPGIVL